MIQQAEAILDGKPPIVVTPPVVENPLLKLGYTNEKYALIFGSVDNCVYQSASEAQAIMMNISINVWQLNASGVKCAAQRTLTVHKAVAGRINSQSIVSQDITGVETVLLSTIGVWPST